MIRVRDQISRTTHRIYGRLTRGFIRVIKPEHYDPLLFEYAPEKASDIIIDTHDEKGRKRTAAAIEKLRDKAWRHFKKHKKKRFEEENKLAIERKKGR